MINEICGWIFVFGGLVMGLVIGVKFQREDWLGGYNAFPRRMVRLAHVALVAPRDAQYPIRAERGTPAPQRRLYQHRIICLHRGRHPDARLLPLDGGAKEPL